MAERSLFRIGSMLAIAGTILGLVVNISYPRASDPSDTLAMIQQIADSTVWTSVNVGVIVSVLFVAGGLLAIYRSITGEPAAALARLGFTGVSLSSAVALVEFGVEGIAMKRVAEAWASAPAAEKAIAFRVAYAMAQIDFALFTIWVAVFFGGTFILYGLAVALSNTYPKWLGWVAVLGGVGASVVGLVQAYSGPSALFTNTLFALFSLLLTVWIFTMGVLLWRKASTAA